MPIPIPDQKAESCPLSLSKTHLIKNLLFFPDITGEIRLFHDQDELENDQTINDLKLGEKSKLQLVIGPAKDVQVTIQLPMIEEKQYKFSNNLKVSEMLQDLRRKGMLWKPLKDYYVMHGDTELDLDMPLHVYNIEEGALQVMPTTFGVHVIDEFNDRLYVTVNAKTDTIADIKKKVARNSKQIQETHWEGQDQPYCILKHVKVYENVNQMRMYIQNGNVYDLLCDDCTIKESGVTKNKKLHLVYYDWESSCETVQAAYNLHADRSGYENPVKFYCGNGDPNDIAINPPLAQKEFELDFIGRNCTGRTILSVALRLQEQFDIPMKNIHIYSQYYQLCQLNDVVFIHEAQSAYFFVYFFASEKEENDEQKVLTAESSAYEEINEDINKEFDDYDYYDC